MLVPLILFLLVWVLIGYSYVGFPLLLAILARLWGEKATVRGQDLEVDELPKVAMVVAAYNEASDLPRKLVNTWSIDYPSDRFLLFVGSDGSQDGTADILKSCNDARLRAFCFPQRRGKISVLNELLQQVEADIVVMSDANTMFAPDSVRKLVRYFADPRVGCVSGELVLEREGGVSGEGLYWRYENWIKRNEDRLGFLIGCNGGIFALRRHLYEPLPTSTVVEDFVMSMRVLQQGFQVRFAPEARAYEPPCSSAHAEMVRKIRIGAGDFQAISLTRSLLHPRFGLCSFAYWSHKILRWITPILLLIALAANIILCSYYVLFWGFLLLHFLGLGLALFSYLCPPEKGLPRLIRPISYFYLMNIALMLGLFRYLSSAQPVTWDRLSR